MACWYCGAEIPENAETCSHCGASRQLEGCSCDGGDIILKNSSGEVAKIKE